MKAYFPATGSYYYGNNTVTEEILIPEMEEPQTDRLFWGILIFFLFANGGGLYLAVKNRRQQGRKPGGIADKRLPLVQKENGKTTFYGKLVIIKQTNLTMLFEEINPQKPDLYLHLRDWAVIQAQQIAIIQEGNLEPYL